MEQNKQIRRAKNNKGTHTQRKIKQKVNQTEARRGGGGGGGGLFVGCLTSQQHASVSQGRIC